MKIKNYKKIVRFKFIIIFLTVFFVGNIFSTNASTINSNLSNAGGDTLKNGLVGWWTLDGADIVNNVVDKSGSGNTGYLQGFTSTSSAKVAGKLGQALKFNKTAGNVVIKSTASLQPSYITLSGWLKYKKTPVSGEGAVIEKGANYGIRSNAVTKINFVSRTVNNSWSFATNNSNTALKVGVWYHVAITYDGITATYYINGVPDGTDTSKTGALYVGVADLNISKDSNNKYLDSIVDDVRIYNRVLSPSEIKSLYNLGADKINSNLSNAGGDTLKNGLVGWWTFDGADIVNNVVDKSGSGNTGYMVNMATATAKVAGKLGQALSLNGTNNYIASNNVVNITNTTISAWVKIDKVPTQNGLIVGFINGIGSATHDKDLYIGTDGKLYFYVYDNAPKTTSAPSTAIPLNTWVHVVGIANGSSAKTYVNGIEVGTVSAGNTYSGYTLPDIFIGGATGNIPVGGGYFTQKIDDVRIYNRALSPSEIKSLYNLGADKINSNLSNAGGDTLKNGLVGWWTFDGADIVNNVVDKSGSGNTGYMVNMATATAKVAGKLGQALKFDGVNDCLPISNLSLTTKTYTFSTWIKGDMLTNVGHYILDFGLSPRFVWAFSDPNGQRKVSYYDGDASFKYLSNSPTDYKWHHMALVLDNSSGVGSYYQDSVFMASTTYTGLNLNASSKLIGSNYASCVAYNLKGKIDDFRIYNRALTSPEIKQLYNLGR